MTGVATEECPHELLQLTVPREQEAKERARWKIAGPAAKIFEGGGGLDIGQDEGTGALVYDSSEFEQAMRILDGAAVAGKGSNSLSPVL